MSTINLEILGNQARRTVACNYCFSNERDEEWGKVPTRPIDREDDVAAAPWVSAGYKTSSPRVVVMMLNPGHAAADHKQRRKQLGIQLRDGAITYDEYNNELAQLVPKWGFGRVVKWINSIGLDSSEIAFLNVALCAVANDQYFPELFETCFARHTRSILSTLSPHVVLLCGKKQLEPYVEPIESLGSKVILTWHYRPMNTTKGKAELQRVRTELEKLA